MTPLEAAKRLADEYGKPADHAWRGCSHPTTQEGGDGCHSFASCHARWPERCRLPEGAHHQEGSPWLVMPQIVAVIAAAEQCVRVTDDKLILGGDEALFRLGEALGVIENVRTGGGGMLRAYTTEHAPVVTTLPDGRIVIAYPESGSVTRYRMP